MAVFGVSKSEEMVYRHFLRHPNSAAGNLHLSLDIAQETAQEALGRLLHLRLLRPGDPPELLTPADPETAVARLTQLRLRHLYQEVQHITTSHHVVAALRAETRPGRAPAATGGTVRPDAIPPVEHLGGLHEVTSRMEDLTFFARDEILSADPWAAAPAGHARHAQALDLRALRRGVKRRMVVPAAALDDRPTLARLAELVAHGARIRVVAEVPAHAVVYDRRAALLPQDPGEAGHEALLVHGEVLLAGVVALFEKTWEQAEDVPLELRRPVDEEAGLSPVELQVLTLMCTVGKDETGARDLGVSVRTYRRYVADVMRRLGASTRAQAALLARERGWI
ncbi:helix-turn-helix transcriptional regulator [Streptomyces johnsoniae]|uniref:Helix-turn-helix transcriptional regulator n=1 Tax=Streptomyces johnsoniae TaxID=3075532 RepID=A0ABU2S5U2_9ACTN|nr:helix-turn-helix transcriptional regulator [Streptomyces sp. DSM 41886]MDT0444347.1 helix-turn-helix transcriptional regulator [Streptomyces sp. DSM 41886]